MTVKYRVDPARRKRVQFSASQVDLFRTCPRKWYLQYVCGVRTPASPSQALGTAIHSEFEGYLISGQWPGKDKAAVAAAQAAVKNLPKPGKDLAVEAGFVIPLGTTATDGTPQTMIGFVDLAHGRAAAEGKLTVRDHKTTKDYVWNKTEAELRHNVQANVYAFWGYGLPKWPILFPVPPTEEWRALWEEGVETVEFGHHYVKTQGQKGSTVVATPMPWEKVAAEWTRIKADIEAMTELAATGGDDPLLVAGEPKSCSAYGGCYFGAGRRGVGLCTDVISGDNLTKKIRSEAEQKEMEKMGLSIREKMEARRRAQQGLPPLPTATEAAAPAAPAGAPSPAATAPAAPPAAAKAPEPTPAPAPVEKAPEPAPVAAPVVVTPVALAEGVIPGDAPPREQSAEEAAALAPTEKVKKRAAAKKAGKTVGDAGAAAAPSAGEIATVEADLQEKADAVRATLDTKSIGDRGTAPAGLKLCFVDSLPIDWAAFRSAFGGMEPTPLERWLDPIKRAVADEFGESDYQLIEFGKGRGALAAAIKASADMLPAIFYVSSFSRSSDLVVDEAIAQGYVVIKATRG